MQELSWLLLPVAAASGWWAATRSGRDRKVPSNETNPVYFRGLNHLLNEEPDKAIDVFVEMLEVDSDTVETHLALGNLFRRRGEVERAIRIHQNLIARPALSGEHRGQALLELGQDYFRAGLYDRAENLFNELRQDRQLVPQALRNLLLIYQQERDWEACLKTATELEGKADDRLGLEKSHYYCELAKLAQRDGRDDRANELLLNALEEDPACVRASHLRAKMALARGDTEQGLQYLQAAVEQNADYLPEVVDEIVEAFRSLEQNEAITDFLRKMALNHPNQGAELHLVDQYREQQGEEAAIDYLSDYIARTPSLLGLIRLLELQCSKPEGRNDTLLQQVRMQLQRLIRDRAAYQCGKCGFEAKTLHWQCPSCHSWGTLKRRPLRESN